MGNEAGEATDGVKATPPMSTVDALRFAAAAESAVRVSDSNELLARGYDNGNNGL